MSFRRWVEKLRANGKLTEAKNPLSSRLEAAAFIKARISKKLSFLKWIRENSPSEPETRCA